jgi:Na+/H+ antiporter NhaC
MSDNFTISLPDAVPEQELKLLVDELRATRAVENVLPVAERGVGAAEFLVWIQVVGGALGAVSTAVGIFEVILKKLRGSKTKGATITLLNGTKIALDGMTAEEVAKVVISATR